MIIFVENQPGHQMARKNIGIIGLFSRTLYTAQDILRGRRRRGYDPNDERYYVSDTNTGGLWRYIAFLASSVMKWWKALFLAAGSARLVENNPSRSVVQWSLGLLDGWWPSSAPIALFINFCQSLTIKLMYWWCYLTTTWNSNSTALDLNHQREKHGAN